MSAYALGRKAGHARLAIALNPFADDTHDAAEWQRGWILATGELLRDAPKAARLSSAIVHPHPSMTGEQIELLCRRQGLALAHIGRERFVLVQTSARPQPMLRIATEPEAA